MNKIKKGRLKIKFLSNKNESWKIYKADDVACTNRIENLFLF